ncbi:MAG: dephospho-CoA kinase [Syntrophorhabdaceae bacterium]|nr:dephospho-CoA kinase [Syntrophorhabdales bacterium]MBP9560575.1 dephospho-CoA kinase [Syntrophorhabdaceae bacterium]
MILIGITGIIGSGKSTVSSLLKERGFNVIDLDRVAKESLNIEKAKEGIKRCFGEGALINGRVNPERLREVVFTDKNRLKELEDIIHPLVIEELYRQADILRAKGEKSLIVDGPLIFETGLNRNLDKIIVVSAEPNKIRERLKARGMDEADIERRISCQIPLKEKEKQADYVLYNNGTEEELREKISILIERIREWEEQDAP